MIVLSKRCTSDVHDAALKRGDICICLVFTEYLSSTALALGVHVSSHLSTLKFVRGKNISILKLRMAYFEIDVVPGCTRINTNSNKYSTIRFWREANTKYYQVLVPVQCV